MTRFPVRDNFRRTLKELKKKDAVAGARRKEKNRVLSNSTVSEESEQDKEEASKRGREGEKKKDVCLLEL